MHSKLAAAAASVLAASSLAACAPAANTTTAATDGKVARCFRTDSVRNFRADRSTDL